MEQKTQKETQKAQLWIYDYETNERVDHYDGRVDDLLFHYQVGGVPIPIWSGWPLNRGNISAKEETRQVNYSRRKKINGIWVYEKWFNGKDYYDAPRAEGIKPEKSDLTDVLNDKKNADLTRKNQLDDPITLLKIASILAVIALAIMAYINYIELTDIQAANAHTPVNQTLTACQTIMAREYNISNECVANLNATDHYLRGLSG